MIKTNDLLSILAYSHGWSIGGFTASVLAMNYPDIKGVVSFIDLFLTTYIIT